MKGKQLALLLAAAAVLGGGGFYFYRSNNESWKGSGNTAPGGKVLNLALNDVAHITIKAKGGEVNLVKKGEDWTVQERAGYPASYELVSGLLRKIWDLKTVQEQKVGPSQFARLELETPDKPAGMGTLLEFKAVDGKSLGGLILGKRYLKKADESFGEAGDFPAGRYVVPTGTGASVSLVSDTLEEANTSPPSWLNHEFFTLQNVVGVSLAGLTEAQHWKITRENPTSDWKLDGAKPEEKLDSAKVSPFATSLANASFTDVLAPDAKPEETGLDKPTVLMFETSDNLTYTLKIGKPTTEAYPVLVEVSGALAKERTPGKDEKPEDKKRLDDEFAATKKRLEEKLAAEQKLKGRPYLIAKFSLEQLLKDRAGLLEERKPETPPAPGGAGAPPPSPGASAAPHPVLVPPTNGVRPLSATTPPISVTTPPVSVPAANPAKSGPAAAPVAAPAVPPTKPVTPPAPAPPEATTPPVTVPPTTPAKPAPTVAPIPPTAPPSDPPTKPAEPKEKP